MNKSGQQYKEDLKLWSLIILYIFLDKEDLVDQEKINVLCSLL